MKNWTCEDRWIFFSALRFFRHTFALVGAGAAIVLLWKYAVVFFSIGALIGVFEHILMVRYKDCAFGPPSLEKESCDSRKLTPRAQDNSKRYKPLITDKD